MNFGVLRELLIEWSTNVNSILSKYDKYWGSVERINKLIFIAVVLDPRYKLDYISFCFSNIYKDAIAKVMVEGIKNYLIRLYGYYKFYDNAQDHHQSESRLTSKSMSMEMDTIDEENLSGSILVLSRYKRRREKQHSLELKNDVDRYLSDSSEELDDNFDVLAWWKANEFKYRVLSKIAQDVLAVPVSTISFESAFSKGGRILDSFRSFLTPKTMEALTRTQNWIDRKSYR